MTAPQPQRIATSSIEEALDFAASLLTAGIHAKAQASPSTCAELVNGLANYMQLRYVGELGLAWEELVALARVCAAGGYRHAQFWDQVGWLAVEMGYARPEPPLEQGD